MKALRAKNTQVLQAIIKKFNDFYLFYSFNLKVKKLNDLTLINHQTFNFFPKDH